MEDINRLKSERDKEKRKVLFKAKRLLSSIEKQNNSLTIQNEYADLEKSFMDFCLIDEEYSTTVSSTESVEESFKVVDGLDLLAYTTDVNDTHDNAATAYQGYLDMQAENQVEEAARPVVRMIEVNMAKCSRIITRIKDTLSLHVYNDSIHYDIAEMEKAVHQVSELRCKLISIKSDDRTSSIEYAVDNMITEADDLKRTVILISRQTSRTLPPLHPINGDISAYSEGADEYEEEHISMSDRPVLLTSSHTDMVMSSASQNSPVSLLSQPAAHLDVEQCKLDSVLKTVGSTATNSLPSSIATSSCTVPGRYPYNSTVADSSASTKQSTAYNPIADTSASVKQSIPYTPILKSHHHGNAKQMNGTSSAPANNVSSMQLPIYGHIPGPIMSTHTSPSYEPSRSGFIEQPSCESIVSYYAGNAAASSVAQSLSFDTGSNRMSKGVSSQFTPSPGYSTVGSSMLNVPISNLTTSNTVPHSHYLSNQIMSNRTGYHGQYLPPSVSQGIGVDFHSVNNASINNSNSGMMPLYGTQSRDNFSMYRPNVKVERTSFQNFQVLYVIGLNLKQCGKDWWKAQFQIP